MIIVSQDKEKAKKYNDIIRISYDANCETSEEFWIISIDGDDMAHYKTKERAKEVLHEIIIKYGSYLEGKIDKHLIFDIPKIYEMPKE